MATTLGTLVNAEKHIEHLRAVHFTLVLTALALLAATFLPTPQAVERALVQARQVKEFSSAWKHGEMLSEIVSDGVAEFRDAHPSVHPLIDHDIRVDLVQGGSREDPASVSVRARPMFVGRTGFDREDDTIGELGFESATGLSYPELKEEITTIGKFETLWDRLADPLIYRMILADEKALSELPFLKTEADAWNHVGLKIGTRAFVSPDAHEWEGKGLQDPLPRTERKVYSLHRIESDVPELRQAFPSATHYLRIAFTRRPDPTLRVSIPVRTEPVAIDVQGAIAKADAHWKDWVHGKFSYAFSDLASFAKNRNSMTLDELVGEIQSSAGAAEQTVEVFGAKIPQIAVSLWGGLLLACVQLYVLLHLRTVLRHRLALDAAPWIGGYDDRMSRFVATASIAVLPLVALLRLAQQGLAVHNDRGHEALAVGASAPGIVLAIWTLVIFVTQVSPSSSAREPLSSPQA